MDYWPAICKTPVPFKLPVNPRTCQALIQRVFDQSTLDPLEVEPILCDDPIFSAWVHLHAYAAGTELATFEEAAVWFTTNLSDLFMSPGLAEPVGSLQADVPASTIAHQLSVRSTTTESILKSGLECAEQTAWQQQLCGLLSELTHVTSIPEKIANILVEYGDTESTRRKRETLENSITEKPNDAAAQHYWKLRTEWESAFQMSGVENSESAYRVSDLARLIQLTALERTFDERLHHEKMLSLKELAYGASHEINNPLANISIRAEALANDETDDGRLKALKTIHQQAIRANSMISDMMLFAKPPEMTQQVLNLHHVISSAMESMSEIAEMSAVQTSLLCDESLEVIGSELHLIEAMMALIQNSIDAIGSNGTIAVTASESNDAVEIQVADTGTGMSDEALHHMFDPFYSGRDAGRGIGFGLPKCWRIVTLHNGKVVGKNLPDGGAVFTIQLPSPVSKRRLAG